MREAVALEKEFIRDCLPVNAVGLSADEFEQYIDYIADRRLAGCGLPPLSPGVTNPLPWLAEMMDIKQGAELLRGQGHRLPEGVRPAKGEKDIFTDANRAWVARICREVAANLTELSRSQTPLRLSLNALYELIEKTLVDNNAYFVAKSLLLNRARKISIDRESAAAATLRVIRRNNQVVPWSEQKVEIAVRKTFLSLQRDSAPAVAITKAVSGRAHATKQSFVHIEEIQDMVQEELMKAGHFKVAEAYILFRAQRSAAREAGQTDRPRGPSPAAEPPRRPP
jgi:hypothetical protein